MIIGLVGHAGVGKDTLADYLVEHHGYVKYSMSSPIKHLLNQRYGWTDDNWHDRDWKERPNVRAGMAPDGSYYSPRQMAQWLGTEAGRLTHGHDCWIKHALDMFCMSDVKRFVIPDIRFANESRMVKSAGGVTARILRDVPRVNPHSSELLDFETDLYLTNSGPVDEFCQNAVKAICAYE